MSEALTVGLREHMTSFPFNTGLNFFKAGRGAVLRVVRDVNERVDFFYGGVTHVHPPTDQHTHPHAHDT